MSKDIHTEHCCIHHGCKYGKDDCPVETGQKQQSYPCEQCGFEEEKDKRIDSLEEALYGVRLRGYRPATESGEPYESCWCLHMPEDTCEWWKPEVWTHDHRCSAARELFRVDEERAAKRAKEILEALQNTEENN